MTTLMAWNILHGGGRRRIPEITLALLEAAPDVLVVNEYRSTLGGQLRGVLADHGWSHQACTDPPRNRNGTLIVSRDPIRVALADPALPACLAQRWLEVELGDLVVVGLHLPEDQKPGAKLESWSHLLRVARDRLDRDVVFLGDFNTGRHRADEPGEASAFSAHMGRLWSMGYRDAWRELHPVAREASWQSPFGEGFRIDHAFVSPSLSGRLREARYLHDLRENGLSDHSALLVRLENAVGNARNPTKTGLFSPFGADTPCQGEKTL